ncbi:hypothetical protein F2Q69_00002308 [Brassica cretica]|uniref:Uncharacterized protein n=1 Tax=Brassica cretica TaxID=69181 RepID=A0A8S9PFJ3_BRACR|nr:hypothetical protein F2Q69_00002308 [Brassica cretica]
MEQQRDSRRDDGEEGRRLGLKGFVRSGFSLLDLWKFFLGDRSNHVAELNNPLPTTMLWIRLVGNVSNGCLPLVSSSECDTGEVHLAKLHQLVLATIGRGLDTEVEVTGWRAMGSSGNSRSLVFA